MEKRGFCGISFWCVGFHRSDCQFNLDNGHSSGHGKILALGRGTDGICLGQLLSSKIFIDSQLDKLEQMLYNLE